MAWYSGITSAAKKVASTASKVVSKVGSALNVAPTVSKVASAVKTYANTPVPKSIAQPASTSITKSLFTSPTSSFKTSSTPSFGMGTGQLSGTGLIKNGPGGAGGGAGKSSIPDPTKITTNTGTLKLVTLPTSYSSGNVVGLSGKNGLFSENNGVVQHQGGQSMLPGSTSNVSRGGFGMGTGQLSGTKLAMGDKVADQRDSLVSPGLPFSNAYGTSATKFPEFSVYNQIPQTLNPVEIGRTQALDSTVKPGLDVGQLQVDLNSATADEYNRNSQILGAGGNTLSIENLGGQPTSTGLIEFQLPNGQKYSITEEQYNSNPDYWDSQLSSMGAQPLEAPIEETLESPLQDEQSQFNLQQEYNRLQEESGITEAVTQWKDLQAQLISIENSLKAARDSIMEDPDFSLATKEGRVNYLFNNSMEARTYEALTKRMETLGDFIEKQNEQIKTQLGFANQDIQNNLAYAEANKASTDNYSLQFNEGTPYVFDKKTGKYKMGATQGSAKNNEPDVLKALNSNQDWQNWQTAETHFSNMKAIVDAYGNPNDVNTWNQLANSAADVRNFAVALARIQDPASARLADAGDAASGQSIQAQASDYVNMLLNDRNATPRNLMEFWNNAGRLLTATYRPRGQAAEQRIRAAYGSNQTLGSDNVDTSAFESAAKAAGYSESQIQQYLAQRGGNDDYGWETL